MTNEDLGPSLAESPDPMAAVPLAWRCATQALTRREMECLCLLVQGLRNADIAERMGCSRKAVEVHVAEIRAKLQDKSRAELAADWALTAEPLPQTATLTKVQVKVLRLAAHGNNTLRIARKTGLDFRRVSDIRSECIRALGVKSTLQAVVAAIRQGLI
jgi:DNA-binding CsgD family transcriptional regulator